VDEMHAELLLEDVIEDDSENLRLEVSEPLEVTLALSQTEGVPEILAQIVAELDDEKDSEGEELTERLCKKLVDGDVDAQEETVSDGQVEALNEARELTELERVLDADNEALELYETEPEVDAVREAHIVDETDVVTLRDWEPLAVRDNEAVEHALKQDEPDPLALCDGAELAEAQTESDRVALTEWLKLALGVTLIDEDAHSLPDEVCEDDTELHREGLVETLRENRHDELPLLLADTLELSETVAQTLEEIECEEEAQGL
jgi:hypothetical protein